MSRQEIGRRGMRDHHFNTRATPRLPSGDVGLCRRQEMNRSNTKVRPMENHIQWSHSGKLDQAPTFKHSRGSEGVQYAKEVGEKRGQDHEFI